MDLDDLFAKRPQDPLTLLGQQDLDPLSVEELALRKEVLQAEIARTESKIAAVVNFKRLRNMSYFFFFEGIFKRFHTSVRPMASTPI